MKHIAVAAIALSLLGGTVAMADSQHERREHSSRHRYSDDRRQDDRRHDKRRDYDRRDHDRRDWRHHDRRSDRDYHHERRDRDRYRYRYGEYYRPSGYYHHYWRRGERMPRAYYSRPYVIYDYHRCGLRAPPRGHHWVRVDRDAVLAVIATGIVLDVIYDNFY